VPSFLFCCPAPPTPVLYSLSLHDALPILGGVAAHYPLDGMVAAARPLITLCGTAARAAPAADLIVTATNKARRRVEQIALREPDDIELDSDTFGYDGLAPGRQRTFTISGGAGVCTYGFSVLFP